MERSKVYETMSEAFLKHSASLISEIYLHTHDYGLAEDCVQDALCVLQAKLSEETDEPIDTQSFLFSVAKKTAQKHVELHSAEVFLDDISVVEETAIDDTLSEEIRFMENEELLIQVLHTLPPKNRRVFVLHHLNGMSYSEIGKLLGMSGEAVRKILRRSQTILRDAMLKKEFSEDNYVHRRQYK